MELSGMGKTEKELADLISKRLGLTIRTGREFLQMLLELVREDLEKTGRSELRGLTLRFCG
jgi:nucleoid DNA-binding protein